MKRKQLGEENARQSATECRTKRVRPAWEGETVGKITSRFAINVIIMSSAAGVVKPSVAA